jgi:hypothetical protein
MAGVAFVQDPVLEEFQRQQVQQGYFTRHQENFVDSNYCGPISYRTLCFRTEPDANNGRTYHPLPNMDGCSFHLTILLRLTLVLSRLHTLLTSTSMFSSV